MTALDAAHSYIKRGFFPIPIPHQEKAPRLQKWQELRLTVQDLPRYFNGVAANIGLILGDDCGTLDVDLDSEQAITIAAELLPETAMVFGRQSKPGSHYFYRSDPPVRSKRFIDPVNKACLIELRCRKSDGSTGLQTVVPPSTHPSGEQVRFEAGCNDLAANVDAGILQVSVAKVAAASLLTRHWPGEKSGRNTAFLALAGILARAGWTLDNATAFHRAIYRALWGHSADFAAADAEVLATYEKHGGGFETTGKPSLYDLADKRAVRTALSWLGISTPAAPARDEDVPEQRQQRPKPAANAKYVDLETLMDDDTVSLSTFAIEGFLPKCGLLLFGGRPKTGKSWVACQLALSVATGEALGGWLRILEPGRVQLWALEDQYALTKDKISKLLRGTRPDALRDIKVFAELHQPILRGGDQIIRRALEESPAELVILDSLFKLTGHQQPNHDISQRDYDVIDRLRSIALDHHCAVWVNMHTRKGARGGDPIENLLGTSGNTAACDVACELSRKGFNGRLAVRGRMVEDQDFELLWHQGDTWGWAIQGTGGETVTGETQDDVLAYLEAQGAAKPGTIAAGIHRSFNAVWGALNRLQQRGLVAKGGDRKWSLPKV